jgi:hypothetical protein
LPENAKQAGEDNEATGRLAALPVGLRLGEISTPVGPPPISGNLVANIEEGLNVSTGGISRQILNNRTFGAVVEFGVSKPGTVESWIPIWGNARNFSHSVNQGNWTDASFYAGMTILDAFFVRSLVTGFGRLGVRVGRFFYDPRNFPTISRQYWLRQGGAHGRDLHHWLFRRSATWPSQGFRNAGFGLACNAGPLGWVQSCKPATLS